MARSFEVIDADGHITDTDVKVKEYLEAPYRNRRVAIYPSDNWDRSLAGTLGASAKDAKSWLDVMDQAELTTSVLFPTSGLGFGWLREPDFTVAVARAYNNFVAEEFQKASPRLKGVALVPMVDVSEGVKELRRAIKELGMVGVMLPAIGLRKPLGHTDYWPIYEEAEKLDCMLAVHATVRGAHYFGADIFDQFIDVHTLSHPFAQMMQMTSIIMRGVMEKFSRLRIAFMEAGCTWVPYWMG
ncbi:MAG: amidohydrolase family protein, partial [Deltaproteobacteria bacterium]|nr:amidohydrolase family protein [Deltaproteobacteria bacterium]